MTLSDGKDSPDINERRGKSVNKISGSMATDGEHCSAESKETVMNESSDSENASQQKSHHKGKRWTNNSNTLREPLLQD